jgi:pyruvate carboxylase
VQILGDRHGEMMHLYERDCSVQRGTRRWSRSRPRWGSTTSIRRPSAMRRSQLARAAGYYNAGTVEFLVDTETGEWFFIEVNPRIQVEHTVTEHGDRHRPGALPDPNRAGPTCTGRRWGCRRRRVPLHGYALQCRVTTEDPQNHFVPDYGKIHTYRSPAGFGIRLDGGSAYSGAVITRITTRCW